MRLPRLLRCISFLVLVFARSLAEEPAPAETKASLLTPKDKPVSLEEIEKLAPGAKVTRSEGAEGLIRFTAEWDEATVNINFKPDFDRETQTVGALGFISKFPEEDRKTPDARKLAAFIPSVQQAYGIILPRGFDSKGQASALLRDLAKQLDGYVISGGSFYDSLGFRVLGSPFDSPFLGRAGRGLYRPDPATPTAKILAGAWDATFGMKSVMEDATMQVWMESVDVFGEDGSHRSKGTMELLLTPTDAEEGFIMSLDFENTGGWEEKDGKIVIHAEKTTTANHQAEIEELKEVIEEMAAEMRKTTDPDLNWMIYRNPDLILFEESEVGITGQMKRKEASVEPKAPAMPK
ncbi:hypothetical protein OKA04_19360 [Luteolibacter flavescens]|uniref:Uncharacterized protein n=1 Tax=Luteolibacter flavescens TaxID=1859460 RepID=A0ABT3FTP6_9BACT|nr:hypothetical protein [Luteolibacter flavescens]MCW1886907.1 hypothetical protein [Luteolibacter flavescens]